MSNGAINMPLNFDTNKVDAQKQTNSYSSNQKNKTNSDSDFKNILDSASRSSYKKTDNNNDNSRDIKGYKAKETLIYAKKNEVGKSEVNEVEDLDQEVVAGPEDVNLNKNELSTDLMFLLQQLLQGEITFEEFATEVSQGNDKLEELSMELTGITLEAIKENFQLSSSDLKALEGKLSNDLTEILQKMLLEKGQENKSFEAMMDKINETIKKALEEAQISQLDGNKPTLTLQEQILNNIKNKLKGNTENQTSEFNDILNSNSSESLQDSLITKSQSTNNNNKDSSKEGSSEDKFLKELVSGNKNDITNKVDKLVNFMNGFNKTINTSNISEVQQVVTVNRDTFINDIIKSVKFMQQNDMKEMTVKIMPRELGEIVIKLTMENGLMKANITANNKEAYNLLNSNIQEISNKLGNEQIKIQNFTVDINNGDTTFFSRENNREQNKQSGNRNGRKSNVSSIGNETEEISNTSIVEENNLNAFV